MRLKPFQLLPRRAVWHRCCSPGVAFNDGRRAMLEDRAMAGGVLSFLTGDSTTGSLVWLRVIVAIDLSSGEHQAASLSPDSRHLTTIEGPGHLSVSSRKAPSSAQAHGGASPGTTLVTGREPDPRPIVNVKIIATHCCSHCPSLERELADLAIAYELVCVEARAELGQRFGIRHSPSPVVDGAVAFRSRPSEAQPGASLIGGGWDARASGPRRIAPAHRSRTATGAAHTTRLPRHPRRGGRGRAGGGDPEPQVAHPAGPRAAPEQAAGVAHGVAAAPCAPIVKRKGARDQHGIHRLRASTGQLDAMPAGKLPGRGSLRPEGLLRLGRHRGSACHRWRIPDGVPDGERVRACPATTFGASCPKTSAPAGGGKR
jgi:hypothetical protein